MARGRRSQSPTSKYFSWLCEPLGEGEAPHPMWSMGKPKACLDLEYGNGENGLEGKNVSVMEKALRWAAEKRKENEEDGVEQANLVVLAGSLYLVTDFFIGFWISWYYRDPYPYEPRWS